MTETGAADALHSDEDHQPDYDRHEAMFPEGTPDAGIVFLNVHRQTLTELDASERGQGDGEDGDLEDDGPDLRWHIYGMPNLTPTGTPSDEVFLLFGDLAVTNRRWFLGVTTAMGVTWRDRTSPVDPHDIDDVNRLSRTLGAWASTPLYDVAALVGRQLIGSNFLCDLELPMATPKPHFTEVEQFAPRDQAQDSEAGE